MDLWQNPVEQRFDLINYKLARSGGNQREIKGKKIVVVWEGALEKIKCYTQEGENDYCKR